MTAQERADELMKASKGEHPTDLPEFIRKKMESKEFRYAAFLYFFREYAIEIEGLK